ncbi:MAG: glycosyltransferase family 39 protein [Leptolyngbya sp.]|nr:glycosyltransferase family 39 protein [Leptolyngbya sp.]
MALRSHPPFSTLANLGQRSPALRDGLLLAIAWLLILAVDGLWLYLDQAPPAWDQGDHLNRALEHWRLLQGMRPLDPSWWQALWALSPGYRAPLVYLLTTPWLALLGPGFDQAMVVNLALNGVLMAATYGLGRTLFDRATGLWAALLCPLVPMLVATRLDYLLDYGLATAVTLFFYCLTRWRLAASPRAGWGWTVAAGITCGLAVLAKFTSVFFLFVPLAWCLVETLIHKRWLRLGQFLCLVVIAVLVFGPWFQVNWLTVLTTSSQSNATWIPAGVNPDNPFSVWSYYLRVLPWMLSWPLLWAMMGGGAIALWSLWQRGVGAIAPRWGSWLWLGAFMGGAYGLLSLLQNKNPRHIMPYLPVVLLALVRVSLMVKPKGKALRGLTIGLVGLCWILGMFAPIALPGWIMQRPPQRGAQWPHQALVDTVLAEEPYVQSVLGVIPNIAQLNPMNVDFYGKLANFQVFGREVSIREAAVPWDAQALDWFLTKSGEQGPDNGTGAAKPQLQAQVTTSPDYAIARTWPLPDQSTLSLYHRRQPLLSVRPLPSGGTTPMLVVRPAAQSVSPGETLSMAYDISGDFDQLKDALLLLTWQPLRPDGTPMDGSAWVQDHGVGFGLLQRPAQGSTATPWVQVSEKAGMGIPLDVAPGTYGLVAQLLDRATQTLIPLTTTSPALTLTPPQATVDTDAVPALRPDLPSTLRHLAQGLAQGNLDPIFDTVGRINQYDPYQDYLRQTETAMAFRLRQDPNNVDWLYALALAQVLQQKAAAAAETFSALTQITPDNPYPWAYLAFVNLYQWRPYPADKALAALAQIDPALPELPYLQAVTALQQGNLWRVWQILKSADIL